jgi:hypothetical protein
MQTDHLEDVGRRGGRGAVLAFFFGLVFGAVGGIVGRPYIQGKLPAFVRGETVTLEGPATAKGREEDRLLITVATPAGAILATFKKRVEEIDLLVQAGDTVAIDVPAYQPFVENPRIVRVRKASPEPAPAPVPEPGPG